MSNTSVDFMMGTNYNIFEFNKHCSVSLKSSICILHFFYYIEGSYDGLKLQKNNVFKCKHSLFEHNFPNIILLCIQP